MYHHRLVSDTIQSEQILGGHFLQGGLQSQLMNSDLAMVAELSHSAELEENVQGQMKTLSAQIQLDLKRPPTGLMPSPKLSTMYAPLIAIIALKL